jgi:hypothetical protein
LGNGLIRIFNINSSTQYVFTIYAKSNGATSFKMRLFDGSTGQSTTITKTVNNEWQRFDITRTSGSSTSQFRVDLYDNNGDLLIYGAQFEAGAYATSYIGPTLGSAVTRGADSCYKTGISSLIGQTEGTLFFEINDLQNFYAYLGVDNISSGTRILIYGIGDQKVYTQVRNASTIIFSAQSAAISGAAKAAVAFNSSGSVFYVNGVQVSTGSGTTYTNLSQLTFNHTSQVGAILSQAILFPTRLSNADLAALTA